MICHENIEYLDYKIFYTKYIVFFIYSINNFLKILFIKKAKMILTYLNIILYYF